MIPQLCTSSWTLEDGLLLLRSIHEPLSGVGFAVALGGSLAYKGWSDKDADIIIFPLCKGKGNIGECFSTLEGLGWSRWFSVDVVQQSWRKIGSTDTKHVEVWKTPDGRRVDLILLECS